MAIGDLTPGVQALNQDLGLGNLVADQMTEEERARRKKLTGDPAATTDPLSAVAALFGPSKGV